MLFWRWVVGHHDRSDMILVHGIRLAIIGRNTTSRIIESEEAYLFESELKRWTAFRNYQQHIRKDPEKFPAYRQYIRQYREENALESPVQLHLQAEQQTKLDEWKEYQVIQHRKLAKKQRKLRKTQREVELAHEGLEAADSDNLRVGDRRSDTHIPRQGGRR